MPEPGDAPGPVQRIESGPQALAQATDGAGGAENSPLNLDALAERVLALLKRELWIERERAGRG